MKQTRYTGSKIKPKVALSSFSICLNDSILSHTLYTYVFKFQITEVVLHSNHNWSRSKLLEVYKL